VKHMKRKRKNNFAICTLESSFYNVAFTKSPIAIW